MIKLVYAAIAEQLGDIQESPYISSLDFARFLNTVRSYAMDQAKERHALLYKSAIFSLYCSTIVP